MQVCWTHRPESKLSHRHRRTDLGPFDRSFLFPTPLDCLPDSLRKKPCKQVDCPNCASTFWRLAQWRISEHKTVNTAQKLMRGRMFNYPLHPPLSQTPVLVAQLKYIQIIAQKTDFL